MSIDFEKYNRIDYKTAEKTLEVKDLHVSFKSDAGVVKAIRGVSFDLYKGETLCIVGESGCGKSTVCKTLMGILANEAIIEKGSAIFEGEDLTTISEDEFHRIRGNKIGMIFQDPLSSLNPIMKVGKQIIETTMINKNILKRKYDNLISKELIAYKNAQTDYVQGKAKLLQGEDFYLADRKETLKNELYRLDKKGKSAQEKKTFEQAFRKETKEEYAKLKKENAEKRKSLKEQYKAKKPALVSALNAKKKEAKKEVQQYHVEVKKAYTDKVRMIKLKLHEENTKEQIEELNKELQLAREEYQKKTCISKKEARKMALDVMREVGINNPEQRFNQYPFEFSGGMRQRIVIAIALTANPEVLICDEPTTALDVTIQAQILELINRLKKERNMSIIFITHDLGVVANMADRIAVMYAGKIVEIGTAMEVFFEPKHPYTWALLSSIPDINSKEKLEAIPGTPPNLVQPPKGDAFADRNHYALSIDYEYEPPFFKLSDTHYAATWLLHEKAPHVEPPKIVTQRISQSLKEEEEYESQH